MDRLHVYEFGDIAAGWPSCLFLMSIPVHCIFSFCFFIFFVYICFVLKLVSSVPCGWPINLLTLTLTKSIWIYKFHWSLFVSVQITIFQFGPDTLLAKKVVTPPLKTIKPMWIELLCFHLAEIGMTWTRDCSPTKSDITLGRHSMQGQVGLSSSETTV